MAEDVKRRRRWKVTLYNPLAFRRIGEPERQANIYTDAFRKQEAEGASMGRAFTRALTAGGSDFLTQPARDDLPPMGGYDYCGVAVSCYEAARAGMMRHPSQVGTRVSVLERGFTVEIERIR